MKENKGGFTLPGEAGYESLTLRVAEKWGADVIRDSDGTALSDAILQSDYKIYSTICIIRDHNEWAKKHMDTLQQTFLCTPCVIAKEKTVTISLMDSFFKEQFSVNDSKEAFKYWEVYDRTNNTIVNCDSWSYDSNTLAVKIQDCIPYHKYTVSFMAYRIWEEISMYNHTTNHWDKEHLMQIDPRYPQVQEFLLTWMKQWCEEHPKTDVVRFTSLFYNFVWIWGADERNRFLYSDWGSYDFTVSTLALDEFKKNYGYSMQAEDFINKGELNVSHMPCDKKKRDWMNFINDFVISFAKQLIDIVHQYGKKAYVFYDDSWVGAEFYNERVKEFGFDGIIKCVFSGFEVRLCAGVQIPVHELRFHPYLFPVGLEGKPTFSEGGNPTLDAQKYWIQVRRALLREKIDRIGLGGYLHLVEPFPEFCDYIETITDEFRQIKELHKKGSPYCIPVKVAVLHSWGRLRSWTLSGHFHETYQHDLIHINEALSGLPVSVDFISFEDILQGKLKNYDVVINAGSANTAWSGGAAWENEELVTELTRWIDEGGTFIGVNEPSAVSGYDTYFRMAHVLGVDEDTGAKVCHGRWKFIVDNKQTDICLNGVDIKEKENRMLINSNVKVLMAKGQNPMLTVNSFGKGTGIYLSSFTVNSINTRMLLDLLYYAKKNTFSKQYITDNPMTECAYFPESRQLVIINNSDIEQDTTISTEYGDVNVSLASYEMRFMNI